MSSEMYRNPVMYDLFCGGVESGKIKYNEKRGPTTISKLLTMSHEANIRTELWFALEKQNYRHIGGEQVFFCLNFWSKK
jgi:hypothetical protein